MGSKNKKFPPLAISAKAVNPYNKPRSNKHTIYPHNCHDFNQYYIDNCDLEDWGDPDKGAVALFVRGPRPEPNSIIVIRLVDFSEKLWEYVDE